MTKKTFYDILQVSHEAGQEFIEVAYKFIQYAYETLSDPDKRFRYDQSLKDQGTHPQTLSPQHRNDFEDSSDVWWKSHKVTLVVFFAAALIGYNLFIKHEGNGLNAANVSKHLDNEGNLVNGVVENQSKAIDKTAEIENKAIDANLEINNRALDIQRQAEERRRTELEYRANAGTQILDMQRRDQDARLKQIEDQKVQREKDYYACMNAAIDVDGNDKGSWKCKH